MDEELIYSTVPNVAEIKEEQRMAVNLFLVANVGKFFTAKQIAEACKLPTSGTQVEVRKIITMLIESDRVQIVAGVNGFAYVKEPNMMLHYKTALEERQQGLQRRINAVEQIYNAMREGQRTIQR